MGHSRDYAKVPAWDKTVDEYKTGEKVKYKGNIFRAAFSASLKGGGNPQPGTGDPNHNGWRLYDELYDKTSASHKGDFKVIGYIPVWMKDFDHKNPAIYQNITHGVLSFLTFSESKLGDFDPKSLADVQRIRPDVLEQAYRHDPTKILLGIGGAVDYGFLKLMDRIGRNPSDPLLEQTVKKIAAFVERYYLDGVDLDLECWWGKNGAARDLGGRTQGDGPHPAGRGLAIFVNRLRKAMPYKFISAAVFATSWYGNNYDVTMVEHLDWLGLMTYDMTGSWNESPVGPHTALHHIRQEEQKTYLKEQHGEWPGRGDKKGPENNPIHSVEDSLWYWTNPLYTNWQGQGQKVPRSKIAGGVPLYGYDFARGKDKSDGDGHNIPPGYKTISYKDILKKYPNAYKDANANIKSKGTTTSPGFTSGGSYPYALNLYFETPKTAVEKMAFLKRIGAQGVIIWDMSKEVWHEGKSITKALYRKSGNSPKKTPAVLRVPDKEKEPDIFRYYAKLRFEVSENEEKEAGIGDSLKYKYIRARMYFYHHKDDQEAVSSYYIGRARYDSFGSNVITPFKHLPEPQPAGEAFFENSLEKMKADDWKVGIEIHTDEDEIDAVSDGLANKISGLVGAIKTLNAKDVGTPNDAISESILGNVDAEDSNKASFLNKKNVFVINFTGEDGEDFFLWKDFISEELGVAIFKFEEGVRDTYVPILKKIRDNNDKIESVITDNASNFGGL